MRILREIIEDVTATIQENKETGKKNLYIEGVFMQYDTKNKNGRTYPKSIMEKEVNRYIRERIDTKRAYGELTHPNSPTINLDRVSHLIENLKFENGGRVIGKAKILDTPMGSIARGLIEGGANLGVSSRGMGSLKEGKDGMEVQEDFHLVTPADIVSDPSAPDAWVKGIMEDSEWFYDETKNIWTMVGDERKLLPMAEAADKTKKELKKLSTRELQEHKIHAWEKWLKTL